MESGRGECKWDMGKAIKGKVLIQMGRERPKERYEKKKDNKRNREAEEHIKKNEPGCSLVSLS